MIGQAERLYTLRTGNKPSEEGNSKIITFLSGKGGTGKSFLVLNTAFALAEQGARVLVADLTEGFSTLNVMLNAANEYSLEDYYTGGYSLADIVHRHKDNLHFIFGGSEIMQETYDTTRKTGNLVSELLQAGNEYDIILVDNSSGLRQSNMPVLRNSAGIIVTLTPEPTAVMDAYVLIKYLKHHLPGSKSHVVINKCGNREEGKTAYLNLNEALTHFIGARANLLGYVNYDQDIYHSILEQDIYYENHPSADTGKQITVIAESLAEIAQLANNIQSHTK